MGRGALTIAWQDVVLTLRDKEMLAWTFVVPIIFFYFFGTVTDGFGGSGARERIALSVPADAGALLDPLVRRLEQQELDVVVPPAVATGDEPAFDDFRRRLVVPPGFGARVAAGEPVILRFLRREAGPGADLDELRVARAVYGLLADVVLAQEHGALVGRTDEAGLLSALDAVEAAPRPITLSVTTAGRRVEPPTGYEQTVPGTMVMFTMMLLLTTGVTALIAERRAGILRRLASAPMRRGEVIAGKWIARMALALVQLAYAMLVGWVLFDVSWAPATLAIGGLLLAWGATCASLGLLVGGTAVNEGQAIGLSIVGTLVLAALGGCWWPIEVTPPWMQRVALWLPTGWVMDGLHRLVSFGEPGTAVLPHALALSGLALLLGAIAARRFRFV